MYKIFIATLAASAFLSACSSPGQSTSTQPLTYDLISSSGEKIGRVSVTNSGESGVTLQVTAANIPEGPHGIHFHHTGSCEAPSFKSAGGHINPMKKAHGLNNPDGPDNADMPNAIASSDGTLNFEYVNDRLSLKGDHGLPALLDDNGSAIVLHANPDDGITQPIGGAGPRIACAEIK